jgi:solute carrier family 25 folate transporter 32
MVDALRKVYHYEGVPGLYRGFVPGILGVSHGALQFMAYEELKKYYITENKLEADAKLGTVAYLSCAALSKLFAASITYPYQVVRARLQDQHNTYEGVLDVVRKTWR